MSGVRSAAAVELGGVVRVSLGGGRAHGDGDTDLARLARQHLGLALARRRLALVGGAARALGGRVLSLALSTLPPLLIAALKALDQSRVQDVFLRLPRVVLWLPPFPFHVVLHFVLKRENRTGLKTYSIYNNIIAAVFVRSLTWPDWRWRAQRREGCT